MTILGIDTSCYRTSLALVRDGKMLAQRRVLLNVKAGERGLMQSEGVFQHVNNLPVLMKELMREAPDASIDAVCASTRPRPVEGSYMPVFLVGEGFGRVLSEAMRVPFYETTHQQGHLRAAMVDTDLPSARFLAVHLSGGTTEILLTDRAYVPELLGGTSDLHAGQLVDRAGVAMGLSFPAGPEMERLACEGESRSLFPTAIKGLTCSFSGGEAQVMRMLQGGARREDAACEVYSLIARTLAKMLDAAARQTGVYEALLAGGVASSALLKELLRQRLGRMRSPVRLYWAKPELSGDNAVGVALIGWEHFTREESI